MSKSISKFPLELKDRTYRLKNGASPLSFIMSSRDTNRKRLLYFDEETKTQRPLRYARNQPTPFQDEQDANVILEPIIFEDGMLHVDKQNTALQWFLYLTPDRDKIFVEVDEEKDAQEEVDRLDMEAEAIIQAKSISLEQMEAIARAYLGVNPTKMTSAELKRDIRLFARNEPEMFLSALSDPELNLGGEVMKYFEQEILSLRKNDKEVWFNLPSNKKKMLDVPNGKTPYEACADYFLTDKGIEVMAALDEYLV